MNAIEFSVDGHPISQGSKNPVVIYKDGKPMIKNGRVVTRVMSNPKLGAWRQQVAAAATAVYAGPLLTSAIFLRVTVRRIRPLSHFGTGRNVGTVKASAPMYPVTRPDLLKIVRGVEDALSGVVWHDDSQICEYSLHKVWAERIGVDVSIIELCT